MNYVFRTDPYLLPKIQSFLHYPIDSERCGFLSNPELDSAYKTRVNAVKSLSHFKDSFWQGVRNRMKNTPCGLAACRDYPAYYCNGSWQTAQTLVYTQLKASWLRIHFLYISFDWQIVLSALLPCSKNLLFTYISWKSSHVRFLPCWNQDYEPISQLSNLV